MSPARRIVLGVVVALCLALTSCGTDAPRARPVSDDEAQRLAVSRFLNYQAGGRAVTVTVPTGRGETTITGSVDFVTHNGYAVVRTESGRALLQWTLSALATLETGPGGTTPPPQPPPTGWVGRALRAKGSTLDTALLLVLNLAADRPENAQLLRQNGSRWLTEETIRGVAADAFEAPAEGTSRSRIRYLLDENGTMLRVQARLGTSEKPIVVDFDTGTYQPVTPLPGLA